MSKFLDDCHNAMKKQAESIAKTLKGIDRKEVYTIKDKDLIVFLGAGDSYAVAEFGKDVFLAIGKSAVSLSPHEIERLRLTDRAIVIGITASGRSLSTIKALEHAKKEGVDTVVLTDDTGGAATQVADHKWVTDSGVTSYNIAPTSPTTCAMAYLLKLAMLREAMPHSRLHEDSHRFEHHLEELIPWADKTGKEIADMIDVNRTLFLLGEGAQYVAAQIGMMKFNEFSLLKSVPVIKEEFQHHYNLVVEDDDQVVVISDRITEDTDEKFINVMKDVLHMEVYRLQTPKDLRLESTFGQAIANTIALQFAAYYTVLKQSPSMEWFKLPNAKAFDIY